MGIFLNTIKTDDEMDCPTMVTLTLITSRFSILLVDGSFCIGREFQQRLSCFGPERESCQKLSTPYFFRGNKKSVFFC